MMDLPTLPDSDEHRIRRRTIIKAAAWTVPVLTLAVAAPAAAASGDSEVGAYILTGSCGSLGIQGPGFLLTAGPSVALPTGTSFLVVGSKVANIGVFSVSGGSASVTVLSSTSRLITLTADLPAGATLSARTTLSITVAFTLNASVTLPEGYVSTGGKSSATVNSAMTGCTAS